MLSHKFPVFEKKKSTKKYLKEFLNHKNCHNYLQHGRVLKIFLLSYFEYHQILLNITTLEQHHKIERKNSSVKGSCMLSY